MSNEPWIYLLSDVIPEVNEPVFHYTDASALQGMVENRVLWATEASAMNDPSEITQGLEFMATWLRRQTPDEAVTELLQTVERVQQEGHSGVYLLCGSTAGDDVNQWARYAADGHGYAVQLDPSVRLGVRQREDRVGHVKGRSPFYVLELGARVSPWLPVTYQDAEKERLLEELLDSARRDRDELAAQLEEPTLAAGLAAKDERASEHAVDLVADHDWRVLSAVTALSQLIKAPGYEGENEVRAVASTALQVNAHFRTTPYGLARYVEVVSNAGGRGGTALVPYEDPHPLVLPITGVMLGPKLSERGEETIRDLLDRNGLRGIKLDTSKLPLR